MSRAEMGSRHASSSQVALPGLQMNPWSRTSLRKGGEHTRHTEKMLETTLHIKVGRRNERKLTLIECPLCARPFAYLTPHNSCDNQSFFTKHILWMESCIWSQGHLSEPAPAADFREQGNWWGGHNVTIMSSQYAHRDLGRVAGSKK